MKYIFSDEERSITRSWISHVIQTVKPPRPIRRHLTKVGRKFSPTALFIDLSLKDRAILSSVLQAGVQSMATATEEQVVKSKGLLDKVLGMVS